MELSLHLKFRSLNMNRLKQIVIAFLLIFPVLLNAQSARKSEIVLSDSAKISLLTCSPGDELYSVFGHSAIRVKDLPNKVDIVFNYGVFDFSDPNFYPNFVRGRMNYILAGNYYEDFYSSYVEENRSISEQILNFSKEEKQYLLDSLFINYMPEHRYYRYDFFYDNCATRIRNILVEAIPRKIEFSYTSFHKGQSFRQLLMPYLTRTPWSKLGINLLLGIPADKVAAPWDYMFLPDHLDTAFKSAYFKSGINQTPVTQKPKLLLGRKLSSLKIIWWSPIWVFILGLILIIGISLLYFKKGYRVAWFDRILLISVGLLGVVFTFLWVGTAHKSMAWNMNILWANPINLFVAFVLTSKRFSRFVKAYIRVNFVILVFLLLLWPILPQTLPYVIYPLVIALALRMFTMNSYLKAKLE